MKRWLYLKVMIFPGWGVLSKFWFCKFDWRWMKTIWNNDCLWTFVNNTWCQSWEIYRSPYLINFRWSNINSSIDFQSVEPWWQIYLRWKFAWFYFCSLKIDFIIVFRFIWTIWSQFTNIWLVNLWVMILSLFYFLCNAFKKIIVL